MSDTSYVPITLKDMSGLLESQMGFRRVPVMDTGEYVFERPVVTTSGRAYPYRLRVYSSIDTRTDTSRGAGEDAIRVMLIDNMTGKPAVRSVRRVHRTKNALNNLRNRCRMVFKSVLEAYSCPKCGGIMVERTNSKTGGRFMSCARYAPNKPMHCDGVI